MKKKEIFVQVRINTKADLITNQVIDIQAFEGDWLERKFGGKTVESDLKGMITVTMPVEVTTKKKRRRK